MVFSADDRVLIKVLRQEKGYGAKNPSQNFPASQIWGKLQERVYRTHMTLTSWSHAWSKSGNISTRCSSVKRSGSGVHVFQLAFDDSSTRRAFWTQTLVTFDICTDVHFDSAVAYSGHFCFEGDLTKPSITIASVDRFYLNLVICLQLNIALLFQNSVKIWHCLSELWQYIQGVTFFVDTVMWLNRFTGNVASEIIWHITKQCLVMCQIISDATLPVNRFSHINSHWKSFNSEL